MKTSHFLIILAFSAGMMACNPAGRSSTNTNTSDTMPPPDTSALMMPPGSAVDSGMAQDTTTLPVPRNNDSAGKRGGR